MTQGDNGICQVHGKHFLSTPNSNTACGYIRFENKAAVYTDFPIVPNLQFPRGIRVDLVQNMMHYRAVLKSKIDPPLAEISTWVATSCLQIRQMNHYRSIEDFDKKFRKKSY